MNNKELEHVGLMTERDYTMFVNENFENGAGGFKWEFLDYTPERTENYKPIYIYRESALDVIENLQAQLKKEKENNENR